MSKPIRLLIVLMLFVGYSVGCVHFAIQASGAGHGTSIYFAPLASWPLLLVVAVAIGIRFRQDKFRILLVLLGTHELLTLCLAVGYVMDGAELFVKMWNQSAQFLFGGICWYVFGQITLWFGLLRSFSTG